MKFINALWVSMLLVSLNLAFADTAIKDAPFANKADFVTVKGTHFVQKDKPYYIVGTNFWFGGYLGAPNKVGDRTRLIKELDNLQLMGINNLRVLAVSEKSDIKSAVNPAITKSFGEYDEDLLVGLDFLITEMAKRNMTVVLYLNNFWQWSGGMTQYLAWIEGEKVLDPNVTHQWEAFMEKSASFYSQKKAQFEYQKTVKKLVTRVNTITGKSYINDPTILSWQLANEPRPGNSKTTTKAKTIYTKWIDENAKYIHSLDANHLVSTGSEGVMGSAHDEALYIAAHRSPQVDYLTYHMWIKNWSWFDIKNPTTTWDSALAKSNQYLNRHIDIAQQLNKPIVLEEFGVDRDGGAFNAAATTHIRDRFYREVFELIYRRARTGDAIAGYNFWAWGGAGRAAHADFMWQEGDDFTGDPPQEQQGLNSIFDSDVSSVLLIKEYSDKMHSIK
jgi:mannan endo-1,4-beta-mannosidase